ncbi:MAG: hypothetical protein AVDCRST_MAG13-2140, partial [uncultured Solirubrobacteraceae bacterium]
EAPDQPRRRGDPDHRAVLPGRRVRRVRRGGVHGQGRGRRGRRAGGLLHGRDRHPVPSHLQLRAGQEGRVLRGQAVQGGLQGPRRDDPGPDVRQGRPRRHDDAAVVHPAREGAVRHRRGGVLPARPLDDRAADPRQGRLAAGLARGPRGQEGGDLPADDALRRRGGRDPRGHGEEHPRVLRPAGDGRRGPAAHARAGGRRVHRGADDLSAPGGQEAQGDLQRAGGLRGGLRRPGRGQRRLHRADGLHRGERRVHQGPRRGHPGRVGQVQRGSGRGERGGLRGLGRAGRAARGGRRRPGPQGHPEERADHHGPRRRDLDEDVPAPAGVRLHQGGAGGPEEALRRRRGRV